MDALLKEIYSMIQKECDEILDKAVEYLTGIAKNWVNDVR